MEVLVFPCLWVDPQTSEVWVRTLWSAWVRVGKAGVLELVAWRRGAVWGRGVAPAAGEGET